MSKFVDNVSQRALFPPAVPAQAWEQDTAKHALDELFSFMTQYRSSQASTGDLILR
jgi:hypothetical protein